MIEKEIGLTIILYLFTGFIILFYILNYYLFSPFSKGLKFTGLWIANTVISSNIDNNKNLIKNNSPKTIEFDIDINNDLIFQQVRYNLFGGIPNFIIRLSLYIRLILLSTSIVYLLAYLLGKINNNNFYFILSGVLCTILLFITTYILEGKKLEKEYQQKYPVIYFLFYFQKKLQKKVATVGLKNINLVYYKVCKILLKELDELIELYRDYDIKPPNENEYKNAKLGNRRYLYDFYKLDELGGFKYRKSIWKYSLIWDKLTESQKIILIRMTSK